MAEETIGVDLSPSEEDVNSDSGFAAALAEKGLGPEQELEPTGPPQDRLLEGTLPGEEVQAEVPAEAGETEEPQVDPAVAELLAQHGDDPQAALAALVQERENREGLIGRQGQELGDLRQQMAHMEGRLDQLSQQPLEQAPEIVTDEMIDSISTMFEERGPQVGMEWIAENRPDLIEPAINVWAETDPFQAGRFASRYDAFLQEETAALEREAQPQGPDPVLAQMRAREQFSMLAEGARQQLGLDEEMWGVVREHVVPAFSDEATSPLIKNAIISNDPNQQFEGMKAIVSLARDRAIAASTQAAETQAQEEAAAEAEQRKLGAQVATGSLRPAAPEGKSVEEMSSEERIALFKQSLLAAPSTSILDGLTGV